MDRKVVWMVLLCVLLAAGLSVGAMAAVVDSGTCGMDGDNVTWTLDDAGTLTISGTGAMTNYASVDDNAIPWRQHLNSISTVQIEDGVTSIAQDAFANCLFLTSVTIPDSVTTIDFSAFYFCRTPVSKF